MQDTLHPACTCNHKVIKFDHIAHFTVMNFFKEGSMRDSYHIQGRQQALKLSKSPWGGSDNECQAIVMSINISKNCVNVSWQ